MLNARIWRAVTFVLVLPLAVMATSLSLVVIFVPVAFMGGLVGRFFSSFGLTVAFAVRAVAE